MAVSLVSTGVTFPDGSTQTTRAAQVPAFTNRIINGAMMIDQRNEGASISLSTTTQFPVDRFAGYKGTAGATITAQRSTTAPAGFTNSIIYTVSTGSSPAAGDINATWQTIEGFNIADLGWGTANAQTVTLSFWVRSSITGTYSISFANSASNRFYVATYTVNSANTWEQKSVTIAGDTSGTWLTDNGTGVQITWDLGYGSNFNGTAGTWGSSTIRRVSGSVTLAANTGATFYITGVQLEKGSTATSFDYRPYGTELALCQRYYFKTFPQGTAPAQNTGATLGALLVSTAATTTFGGSLPLPVTMRAAPTTVTTYNPSSANANWRDTNNAADRTVGSVGGGDSALYVTGLSGIVNGLNYIHLTASAEL